jgi:hypothetical protein
MATLAEVLRQAGYVTPQGQVTGPRTDLAQKLKGYVTNVIPNALQNAANQRADIDAALTMGQGGIQIGDREAFARQMAEVPNLMGLTAYHGTPHKIVGKFDINKVGTGEGAQAYGHGMYFAEAPQVAETYKRAGGGLELKYPKPLEELGINPKVVTHSMDWDENPVNQALGRIVKGLRTTALDYPDVPVDQKLIKEHFDEYIRLLEDKYPAEAAQKKALQEFVAKEGYPEISFGGNLYKVDIPDEYIPNMLDWDKPLKDQKNVLEMLTSKKSGFTSQTKREIQDLINQNANGEDLIRLFGKDQKELAEELSNLGIKGIRYLDEGSRSTGKGTSNFVVFDPTDVKILEKNSQPVSRKELLEQQIKAMQNAGD